ncbi:hypothetical protein BCR37DRAFT_383335 [Protomyces lactucae-debilis]|uniref:Peroxin-14 n=1 Tax=Protomyces lactucae-debilis TaxID=2754530 RepID=A0A1Y2EZY0_PROLT|nr:uncharacterized protein BCR37DRAFT_383321 [Protomyces lactucae-debilis]XP_040722756.1 uncharacterized protein BCR37DRAFT_383328 [Protomyces lactucae-debilis]XP_040722761.1 uncharacterized protein BCR37DRAFT_383335 [Protomyces lactucae-debilis]ORY76672.1 hypothetical protein BCR37DRAFT_383321 [Protomyces lactucae-debilis]ORY76676.1 hypothetical protein BCR37DRAFT_383328 [Protomyces lactucae-debilis]ORY76681.1 hypothetical protein BCR37DRAFT_383335 [Protomyces lactucae-debilis]
MSSKRRQPLILAQKTLNASIEPPIPFITARRFWNLVYLYLGLTAASALVARLACRPILAQFLAARLAQTARSRDLTAGFVERTGEAININRQEPGGVVVDTTRHKLLVHSYTQTVEDIPETSAKEVSVDDAKKSATVGPDATLTHFTPSISTMRSDGEADAYSGLLRCSAAFEEYLDSLNEMAYQRSYTTPGAHDSTDKGIQKCKADIRSVEGSVLNARNFSSRMSSQQQQHYKQASLADFKTESAVALS